MEQKRMRFLLAVLFSLALTLPAWSAQAATTITSNQTGSHGAMTNVKGAFLLSK